MNATSFSKTFIIVVVIEAAHLIGYFLKPSIDVAHLTLVMINRAGARNVAIFYAFFAFADWSMKRIRQRALKTSMKELAIENQNLESELRTRLSRIDHYREQIALQGGTEAEKSRVMKSFKTLSQHFSSELVSFGLIDVISSYLIKYGGLMTAFSILTPSNYLNLEKTSDEVA